MVIRQDDIADARQCPVFERHGPYQGSFEPGFPGPGGAEVVKVFVGGLKATFDVSSSKLMITTSFPRRPLVWGPFAVPAKIGHGSNLRPTRGTP